MYESEQSQTAQDWERRRQRRAESAELRRKQKRQQLIILIAVAAALALVVFLVGMCLSGAGANTVETEPTDEPTVPTTEPEPTMPPLAWMSFEDGREITASQYFVYDVDADTFLTISGEPTETIYPASITKLFTAYVALQYLEPDAMITVGDALDLVVNNSSVAGIQPMEQLSTEMLVEAMLLPSGNDAACALAVEIGRMMAGDTSLEPQSASDLFVEEMNRQAQALGLNGTHFANPDGIHLDTHYTTFQDLTLLGKLALENPTIMKYAQVSRASITLESGEDRQWKNTNALIDPNSDYYCNCAIGLKTGSTPRAGSCLLSAFECGDRTLIVGVFGCATDEDRFMDTLHLFNEALGYTDTM